MSEIVQFLHFLRDAHPLAMRVWFFGFGACVGSFLNVCILRIPAGKSIVFPGSHCVCGKPIAWYDNIPIFSWFILGGKARCCGQKFSMRYSLVETATACAYLWLWMEFSPTSFAAAFAGMIFFALLMLGAMIDLDLLVLPDITTLGGLVIGLGLSLLWPQIHGYVSASWSWRTEWQSFSTALAGVVVGAGVVYWIGELGNFFLRTPSMGYGDMLLMGCVGAFCGWRGTLFSIFGGAILACLYLLPMRLFAKPAPEIAETNAPAGESATETSDEPSPLGRRSFAMNHILVIAPICAVMAWRARQPDAAQAIPAFIFPVVILALALWKRQKLVLNEAWLLLAVVVGIIVSCAAPQMYGIELTDIWLVNALPAAVLSVLGAVVGAGITLWLLEFANLFRVWFFPANAPQLELGEYDQIWGEGYLLLFGGIGAFGGWRAALMGTAVFAIVGLFVGAFYFFLALKFTRDQPAAEKETPAAPPAAAEAPLAASGFEIPFGPWLALAGFLYYVWLAPYFDRYLEIARATAMGEFPK